MERFAFIIHPIDARRDVGRKYPIARHMPPRAIEWYIKRRDPVVAAHISGIRSNLGTEAEGWFIACPLTARQLLDLPIEFVYDKLQECVRLAENLGAKIVGLGAFTSVVGDGGKTLAERANIAVTTGNSYTVSTAVEGAAKAATQMGIDIATAKVAVVGATGSIGATCAEIFAGSPVDENSATTALEILARRAERVSLVGRNEERLKQLTTRLISRTANQNIDWTTDVSHGLRDADIVITVSSATEAIIQPEDIKRGAVVCDVARPRDVSIAVSKRRDDVLVIEGGIVEVPGEMKCVNPETGKEFSFGFPPGTAYACMSETIGLALEGRYENFTIGKEVSVEQVDTITSICRIHGFRIGGFRSFEKPVSEEEIRLRRERAGRPAPNVAHVIGDARAIGLATDA